MSVGECEAKVLTEGLPAYGHLGSAAVNHRPEVHRDPARGPLTYHRLTAEVLG